jgi:hypothetical protein
MINRIRACGEYELVQSKDECCYQEVLDDFNCANEIYIMTFNISTKNDELIKLLDNLDNDTEIHFITNIPNRYDAYLGKNNGEYARRRAKDNINYYLRKLDPGTRENNFNIFFNFDNHSKIIMTENIAFVGSANYSLESSSNYENGFITRDANVISQIKEIFIQSVEDDSIRYYGTELAKLEVIFMSFYSQVEARAKQIENSLFWEDERGNSRYYSTSAYIDWADIEEINSIVYDYKEKILELEDNDLFISLSKEINERNLDNINKLYEDSGSMYDLAMFNEQDYMENYLQEHLMEAYDEYLDEYAQNASDLANEERERLAEEAESEVVEFYENIVLFQEQLLEVLDIINDMRRKEESNVDNTNN